MRIKFLFVLMMTISFSSFGHLNEINVPIEDIRSMADHLSPHKVVCSPFFPVQLDETKFLFRAELNVEGANLELGAQTFDPNDGTEHIVFPYQHKLSHATAPTLGEYLAWLAAQEIDSITFDRDNDWTSKHRLRINNQFIPLPGVAYTTSPQTDLPINEFRVTLTLQLCPPSA